MVIPDLHIEEREKMTRLLDEWIYRYATYTFIQIRMECTHGGHT